MSLFRGDIVQSFQGLPRNVAIHILNVTYINLPKCCIYAWYSHSYRVRVAQWVRSLDLIVHASLSPIWRGFAPSFVNYKKDARDSQPQVIKLTSCLPRVGGSLRVLRLPPPLKLVAIDIAEILLKVALKHQKYKINPFLPFCILEIQYYATTHCLE